MPRHPPCALHSLSQQRQNNTHQPTPQSQGRRQTQLAQPPPRREGIGLATKMLASTMQISNNNPTNPHHPIHTGAVDEGRTRSTNPHTQPADIHHRPGQAAADSSGPNSVFNHPPANARQMTRDSPRPKSRTTLTVDVPLVRHHHASPDIR